MPTIYTGSYKIPMEAGKGIGAIQAEKESYTRGVEQARLDMAKQQIKDAQTERALARIDADEKETRRQLEWDKIQEGVRSRFKTSQEGIQERWEGLSGAQKSTEDRLKAAVQEKRDKDLRNEKMIKRLTLGETAPTTQPTELPPNWGAEREEFRRKYPETKMEAPEPTPIQKSIEEQYYEGLKKSIKPVDKKRIRIAAVSKAYDPKDSPKQNETRIESKYAELLKEAEEKRQEAVNKFNYRMLQKKQREAEAQQKAQEAKREAVKAGETRKFKLAQTILKDDKGVYSEDDREWAEKIISKYTGGAGTQQTGDYSGLWE